MKSIKPVRGVLAICGLGLAFLCLSVAAQASKFSLLYSFGNGNDGGMPSSGLLSDSQGRLYGLTQFGGGQGNCPSGGNTGCGTLFRLDPDGSEHVLHAFAGGSDGAEPGGYEPGSTLVTDAGGNIYGTTQLGGGTGCGGAGCGVIFKLATDGTESVLYRFCKKENCSDGAKPNGLVIDKSGNLYGTATGGQFNHGVVFELKTTGKEKVLYNFCPAAGCNDGDAPTGGVIRDKSGNFYGVTYGGGSNQSGPCSGIGCGTVYKLSKNGIETVLHNFCSQLVDSTCIDGRFPDAGLVADKNGNLFGTTQYGGAASCNGGNGCGAAFTVSSDGTYTVLHAFTGSPDGSNPMSQMIVDTQGNLFGSTFWGGTLSRGAIFTIDNTGAERVLYSFSDAINGSWAALSPLLPGKKGVLYGTSHVGGDKCGNIGCGSVFMLKP